VAAGKLTHHERSVLFREVCSEERFEPRNIQFFSLAHGGGMVLKVMVLKILLGPKIHSGITGKL
jgi:hypothetical protein